MVETELKPAWSHSRGLWCIVVRRIRLLQSDGFEVWVCCVGFRHKPMIHNEFQEFCPDGLMFWIRPNPTESDDTRCSYSGFWMRPVRGCTGFMGAFPWNPLNMRVLALHGLQWWRFECALNANRKRTQGGDWMARAAWKLLSFHFF